MKIKVAILALAFCSFLAIPSHSFAQADRPAPGTKMTPASTYDKLLSGIEKELLSAAEAMPEDKYDYAPSAGEFKGVRTFGQQVKHVAQANYEFWASFAGDTTDPATLDKLTSKADIVKALKDSLAMAHKAIATITPENAFVMTKTGTPAGMTSFGIAHMMDHYGQMAEYLRMNGIVPPASRTNM